MRRRRGRGWDPEPLADALEVVASALEVGLPATAALAAAGESTAWGIAESARLDRVITCLSQGSPTAAAWHAPSDHATATDAFRTVGGVWDLALQTGGPLAEAVRALSGHLREQSRLQGRLEVLAAGPRTSATVLTLLPLVGPAIAVVVGADPGRLYLATPLAGASATVGLLLTGAGWWWSKAMVERAARPPRYAPSAAGTGS